MTINEKKGNIFALSKDEYVFAHCIATDLQWGAGIAPVMMKQFNASSKWRKNTNSTVYNVGDIGVDVSNTGVMINLLTKSNTHGRPSYQTTILLCCPARFRVKIHCFLRLKAMLSSNEMCAFCVQNLYF